MTICLHVATLVDVSVCARLRVRRGAFVCPTPPCHVLLPRVCMCPFKQGERLLVGSGARIVNLLEKRIFFLPFDKPFQNKISNTQKCDGSSFRKDNLGLQNSTFLSDAIRAILSN